MSFYFGKLYFTLPLFGKCGYGSFPPSSSGKFSVCIDALITGQGFTESFEGVFILLETLRFTFQICKKQGAKRCGYCFPQF